MLKSAQGSRVDPMLMAPTTAGYSLTSLGYALRATAMKVLDGLVEADHAFYVLYELDEGDDWRDEAIWIKAAPMIGITPTLPYVRQYRDDATSTPGLQGEFEVKIANRWLHSANRWLSMPAWQACADLTLTLETTSNTSPAGLASTSPSGTTSRRSRSSSNGTDLVYVFVRGYLPELVVAERARAVPEYRHWVETGELRVTPGNLTDYPTIEADLRADCDRFDVQEHRDRALRRDASRREPGRGRPAGARREQEREGVHAAGTRPRGAHQGAPAPAHRHVVPDLADQSTSASSGAGMARCCRRRICRCRRTRSTPSMRSLLALSALLATPTAPAYEPRLFFLEA